MGICVDVISLCSMNASIQFYINSLIDSCEFDNYSVHESVGVPFPSCADRVGHPGALVELYEHVSVVQRDVEIHTLREY